MRPKNERIDKWGFPLPPDLCALLDRREVRAAREAARAQRGPRWGKGSPQYTRLLQGLRSLCSTRRPGQTFSDQQIADACACSHTHIQLITRSALRKFRARLPSDFTSHG